MRFNKVLKKKKDAATTDKMRIIIFHSSINILIIYNAD